jgi:hypothetical protein
MDKRLAAFCFKAQRLVDREAWQWENGSATGMVDRGVKQAKRGELGDGPDLAAAFAFADGLPDEE